MCKMVEGNCDNQLIASYLSAKCPVYFAPAMDLDMYQHPSTQNNIKKLMLFWVGIICLSVVMLLLSNTVYKLWIGKDLFISIVLSVTMCLSILLTAWYNIFGYFLNSISETKLQTNILIISALINVPLSIFLLDYFESTGVILATCIALLPLAIALPIQYRSIIKKMV